MRWAEKGGRRFPSSRSAAGCAEVLLGMLALVAPPSLMAPPSLIAQEVQGIVRDESTRTPLVNVLVRVDSLGSVTLTDDEGRFILRYLPKGRYTVSFEAMGYETARVTAKVPADEPLEILLLPRPVEVPGIEVWGESVETRMDLRLARLPGTSRVVDPQMVRRYDTVYTKDPWRLLWRELRVGWDTDPDLVRVRYGMATRVAPEVYIDDHRTWLLNLVLMPNTLLCRVEMYQPPPFMGGAGASRAAAAAAAYSAASGDGAADAGAGAASAVAGAAAGDAEGPVGLVPFQLRAYTCLFMAEVAEGKRQMRANLNWGDLIAGPGG